MQITQFNPKEIALKKAQEEYLRKMNIAAELLITRELSIYYSDIMQEVDKDTQASCRSILSWLNDYSSSRDGKKIYRAGIISLYKETHKDHFINGVWQAYNLPELIDFTIKKLTDKNFVGSKSKAALFKTSFLDETWFRQAVSVIGLKMLEDNENLNGLTSNTAKELIFIRKVIKMSYEKTGQIIGRSTKNHNAEYMREELKEITTQTYKFVQQHLKISY